MGPKIYLFGFSRGAYTARFLKKNAHYVRLISADNKELIPFIWKAFTDWKFVSESHPHWTEAYSCVQLSCETMCWPIDWVYFLDLFNTESDASTMRQQIWKRCIASDHSDDGGGWRPEPKQKEEYLTSHIPLTWMINKVIHADLTFDEEKLKPLSICPPSASSSSYSCVASTI